MPRWVPGRCPQSDPPRSSRLKAIPQTSHRAVPPLRPSETSDTTPAMMAACRSSALIPLGPLGRWPETRYAISMVRAEGRASPPAYRSNRPAAIRPYGSSAGAQAPPVRCEFIMANPRGELARAAAFRRVDSARNIERSAMYSVLPASIR